MELWKLCWIAIFIVKESTADKVMLIPYPVATVTENKSLQLTCKINFEQWEQLIFQSSKYKGNSIFIVRNGSSHYITGLSKKDISNYNLTSHNSTVFILDILNVTLSDHNTTILCRVDTDDAGTKVENTTEIRVTVPVKNVTVSCNSIITIQQKQRQILQCKSSPSRPAASLNWYKISKLNGSAALLTNTTSNKTVISYGLVVKSKYLKFEANFRDNGGILFCEAESNGSIVVRSPDIKLNVLYPPVISTKVSTHEKVFGFNLTCTIDSNPLPNITWRRKGNQEVFMEDLYSLNSTYFITNISCEERIYLCRAYNGIGNGTQKELSVPETCSGKRMNASNITDNLSRIFATDHYIIISTVPSVLIVIIIAVIVAIKKRKENIKKTDEQNMIDDTEQEDDNPDSTRGAYRDNVLYYSAAEINPTSLQNQTPAYSVQNEEQSDVVIDGRNTTPELNTDVNIRINSEEPIEPGLPDPRNEAVTSPRVRFKPREETKHNPVIDSGDYKDNVLYESSDSLFEDELQRNQPKQPSCQEKDSYRVIVKKRGERYKNMKEENQNENSTEVKPVINMKTNNRKEGEGNKNKTGPLVELPRRVARDHHTPQAEPRRKTDIEEEESSLAKYSNSEAEPIFHPNRQMRENVRIQSVKPMVIVHHIRPELQPHTQETQSHFRAQSSRDQEQTPPIIPRKQNYIEIDLPTNNEGVIHRKDDKTVYTDVELSKKSLNHPPKRPKRKSDKF